MKSILQLSHLEAKKYFLKSGNYCKLEVPKYIQFEKIISKVDQIIGQQPLENFYKKSINNNTSSRVFSPQNFEGVNYLFVQNKDGKYAKRPFQLIHPAIYVSLVGVITQKENWDYIIQRFNQMHSNSSIVCKSMPMISENKQSDLANGIINWYEQIEQKSIELGMRYEFITHTDITDCYGSIYTHSIAWALHTKEVDKAEISCKSFIGGIIERHFHWMSYGKTNGIPQGSVLMDFIAEIVLGYVDEILAKKISILKIEEYKILRYRDDYRIFTNNSHDAETILKELSNVLFSLNMKLNAQKTLATMDVISSSIKSDKLYWLCNEKSDRMIGKHLLIIYQLAEQFPNSGSLVKALNKFYTRISQLQYINENVNTLISIIVDIAYKNPRVYPVSVAIIGKLISMLKTKNEQQQILVAILRKLKKASHTGHLEVWLQRMNINRNLEINYSETLCRKVENPLVKVWNSDWLQDQLKSVINNTPIVEEKIINDMTNIIEDKEINIFAY